MKIKNITARWLRCDLTQKEVHVSDFGKNDKIDMMLVEVITDNGIIGYGEAKAVVGSIGSCAALVHLFNEELKPLLIDEDPRRITYLWQKMYNGRRHKYALEGGRVLPVLGRRGSLISIIGAVDTALWDIKGKLLGVPIYELLGGAVKETIPAYASGGWASAEKIGEELGKYIDKGFKAIKMRIGAMDHTARKSIKRVEAARKALGEDIDIMVDAHGSFDTCEAKRFSYLAQDLNLRWFEEPVSSDNRSGLKDVKNVSNMPIAVGESEFTRFDFHDLMSLRMADVYQPDPAICGGISEMIRISAMAEAHQVEINPHVWGSTISFHAALNVSAMSASNRLIEFCMGGNPLFRVMAEEPHLNKDGCVSIPTKAGLGVEINMDFVEKSTRLKL